MTDKQIIIDNDKFEKAENEPINQEAVNKFIKETDKFYIDGVDVSGCKYFSKYQKIARNNECIVDIQNACVEEMETKPCRQKHNCYFKNWQRKEQECDQHKRELEHVKGLLTVSNKLNQALLNEREKLKNEKEQQKAELELFKTSNQTTIDQLKTENETLFKAIEEVNKINKRLETENEELKKANLHIENNREHKANKLNRIEKLILACTTGHTDEFIQELLVILHEPEPVSFENKYKQTLEEIKEIAEHPKGCCIICDRLDKILQKISECEVKNEC